MKSKNQLIYSIGILVILLVVAIVGIKYFNLSWVENTKACSTITINFLLPMKQLNQAEVGSHLRLVNKDENNSNFEYTSKWINDHVLELKLSEKNVKQGQKVKLIVQDAPTIYPNITKTANVDVQFKSDINIVEPSKELLVSSKKPFIVEFNTPISLKQVSKYAYSDAEFMITSYITTNSRGEKVEDETRFVFTPKQSLENGKNYKITFNAGMCAKNGEFLDKKQEVLLKVDSKPIISKTYPMNGDKWIGLHPRFMVQSNEPIVGATATINGKELEGTKISDTEYCFFVNGLLKPDTTYKIIYTTQVESGETSQPREVNFTTTTINNNRFWIDIRCTSKQGVYCYEGGKLIKVIAPKMTLGKFTPPYGTYYLEGKNAVYENSENHTGANYWMQINEKFGMHGMMRDSYWKPLDKDVSTMNIVLSDEDAAWLYSMLTYQSMVIVRK